MNSWNTKKTLISADLQPQIISYQLSRVDGENIDSNNRISSWCFLCNSDIGDEFHYILQCQYFKPSRKLLLSKYYSNHVNVLKFRNLYDFKKTLNYANFIKIIQEIVYDTG